MAAGVAEQTLERLRGFELKPEEVQSLEDQLKVLEAMVPRKLVELGKLEEQLRKSGGAQAELPKCEEDLATVERQLAQAEQRARVDETIRELLGEARKTAVVDLMDTELPENMAGLVRELTVGRYELIEVVDGNYALRSAVKGAALTTDELSTGTRDQLYLAMRLAYLRLLFPTVRPPLILDDPLVHCDPARRRAVLRLLAEYASDPSGGQVLLFTCQDYTDYTAYPILDVGGPA
jgi:uncharacterized protein YhaN